MPCPTATEQAEPAVSIASSVSLVLLSDITETRLARDPGHPRRQGVARRKAKTRVPGPSPVTRSPLDRADFDDFGDVMAEHILDPRLQGRGRARAARARALHVQVDDAVLEILANDVAAIHRHRRAHSGLQQFLDLGTD